jgi:Tol biopolymer transport system component
MKLFTRGIRSRLLLTIGACSVVALTASACTIVRSAPSGSSAAATGDQMYRASLKSDGSETGTDCAKLAGLVTVYCESYEATAPSITPDGHYIAFLSTAPDQVAGLPHPEPQLISAPPLIPANKVVRVFRKNTQTGAVDLVSIKDNGNRIDVDSASPSVSADGRYVVFTTTDADVSVHNAPGGNKKPAVYMRDVVAGRTYAISDPNGAARVFEVSLLGPPGTGSVNAQISADGNTVTFQSNDSQVGAGATGEVCENGNLFLTCPTDTYVWTRNTGAANFPWGTLKAIEGVTNGKMSANGLWLISEVGGSLVRRNLSDNTQTTMVDKTGLNGSLWAPAISDDGNVMSFTSNANNIVPNDNNQVADVFVKTFSSGEVKRLSVSASGKEFTQAADASAISADGRWVAFNTTAPLTGPANGNNIYVSSVITGKPALVTIDRSGGAGTGSSPTLDADGRLIAFQSSGTLTPDKVNQNTEVYVYDRNGVPLPQAAGPVWLAAADGGVFAYGGAQFYGSEGGAQLNQPVSGIGLTPNQGGYWLTAADGGIFSFGDAQFFGSMGGTPLNKPVVSIAPTPSGNGYWEVASDGGIFAFGDAQFFGSMGGTPLNRPIVGITATPTGQGYYEVASDGGIFAFGDATYYGSTGSLNLVKPINGMKLTTSGKGYYLVASDGGLFAFGDAEFLGSSGGSADTYVGMTILDNGGGYRLITSDGAMVLFHRNRPNVGGKQVSTTGKLNKPIVGVSS